MVFLFKYIFIFSLFKKIKIYAKKKGKENGNQKKFDKMIVKNNNNNKFNLLNKTNESV